MNKQIKSRGFTIVELLIVIVVIAILAAITIVAYNGIQNRAHNTTANETANQVRTKVEAYNSVKGQYPADIAALDEVDESKLDAAVSAKIATDAASVDQDKPVFYASCTASGSTNPTGGTVTYWQVGGGSNNKSYSLGNC